MKESSYVRAAQTLTLAGAQAATAAAVSAALDSKVAITIVVTDAAGATITSTRMDGAPAASIAIASAKALTSAQLGMATSALQRQVENGKISYLAAQPFLPISGGTPLICDGVVIGAIGVSGATEQQDEKIAEAGAAAIQPAPNAITRPNS